jgi:hypothetical protein
MTLKPPASTWRDVIEELKAADTPHLFFDPFDYPE